MAAVVEAEAGTVAPAKVRVEETEDWKVAKEMAGSGLKLSSVSKGRTPIVRCV